MRIIANADDFGFDADTVAATIECFERGALTSATIMPRMPATDAAVAFARAHPQFSFGVHLTFVADTVERPVLPPDQVPALVRPDGTFLPSNMMRLLALRGRVPVAQIEREAAAQIALLMERGVPVSHVDSHGHLHKFAPFRKALAHALPRFGIRRVRGVQDIYIKRPWRSPTYWLGANWNRRLRARFQCPEHFYMCTSAWDQSWVEAILRRPLRGTIEVGVHPGYTEGWRDLERRSIQTFAQRARAEGLALITWNDL